MLCIICRILTGSRADPFGKVDRMGDFSGKELSDHLGKINQRLDQHDKRFDNLQKDVTEIKDDVKEIKRKVCSIEEQTANLLKYRTETKNALEKMQYDVNYLVRKTSTHDDDIIQLKKAK